MLKIWISEFSSKNYFCPAAKTFHQFCQASLRPRTWINLQTGTDHFVTGLSADTMAVSYHAQLTSGILAMATTHSCHNGCQLWLPPQLLAMATTHSCYPQAVIRRHSCHSFVMSNSQDYAIHQTHMLPNKFHSVL